MLYLVAATVLQPRKYPKVLPNLKNDNRLAFVIVIAVLHTLTNPFCLDTVAPPAA